jgi:thioredoxin 1
MISGIVSMVLKGTHMATNNLTTENLEKTLENNDMVIIDFWAPWCGPCKSFGPIFEKVSEKHTDITFMKVNTEADQELGAMFGIQAIPTLVVFREGIMLYREAGAIPESGLESLIEQVRNLDMEQVHADAAKHEHEHHHEDHDCSHCDHDHSHDH